MNGFEKIKLSFFFTFINIKLCLLTLQEPEKDPKSNIFNNSLKNQ